MKILFWFSLSIALFAAWPLAAAGDQTANKSSPPRVVYLNKSRFWDFMAGNHGHQTLVREFFRQAFLIAARDQLQLTTRDQWLGDSLPGQGSNAPFELRRNVYREIAAASPARLCAGVAAAEMLQSGLQRRPAPHGGRSRGILADEVR